MKTVIRAWRALRFALRALAYHWRHGPASELTRTEMDTPIASGAESELTQPEVLPELVPLEREPAIVPAIGVSDLEPSVPSHDPHAQSVSSDARFFVRSYSNGNAFTAYEGEKGAGARRVIEGLRKEGSQWAAYRSGQLWDWGPR